MMGAKILLALAEAIVYFDEIETSTYGCPKLSICKQAGSWNDVSFTYHGENDGEIIPPE